MKERHYRARCVVTGDFVYGYYYWSPFEVNGTNHRIIAKGLDRNVKVYVHGESVGQHVGFYDKSGRDIYEGDRVKTTALSNDHGQRGGTEFCIVRFYAGSFCLCLNGNECGVPIFPFNVNHTIEILDMENE